MSMASYKSMRFPIGIDASCWLGGLLWKPGGILDATEIWEVFAVGCGIGRTTAPGTTSSEVGGKFGLPEKSALLKCC